jgi:hypothetical protein
MAHQQPDKDTEVTPKGAVEMKEEDLDQASGGAQDIHFLKLRGYDLAPPPDTLGDKKIAPDVGGGGPHVTPEKKI